MITMQMTEEDHNFLKELQHELKTQSTDHQAEPRYWAVAERHREYGVDSDCSYDGTTLRNKDDFEFHFDDDELEFCKQQLVDDEVCEKEDIQEIDDLYDLCEYLNDELGLPHYEIGYYREDSNSISKETGCFLTKRACKQHISANSYHYTNPHTYALTAFRNYEFERLLKVIDNLELGEWEEKNVGEDSD